MGKNTKTLSYKLQSVESCRFIIMIYLLSDHVDNLAEEIHKIKCKHGHDYKQCEVCRIKCKDCAYCREQTNSRDDLVEYKCLCCNKNYQKKFDENLKNLLINIV